jgi:hypothetical protein
MADLLKPGQGFLYMKVGTHAQESLEDIIKRKAKEIRDAGFALGGYGGNTCHPQTMVQPFARECAAASTRQTGGIGQPSTRTSMFAVRGTHSCSRA